ncbi:hypothetical protein [Candidatus Enterovibrio escicola]|uniref:hypothetical protein n=1 Tax=Candidatus Enterovibrio escicola TaxID=1927127 RepID=UPI000BE28556|nr:hypothetical protein [Candidatus Enterovibrio escacola]
MGRNLLQGEKLFIKNQNTGKKGEAIFWITRNVGSLGDGNGHWLHVSKPNDWCIGCVIMILHSGDIKSGL